MGKVYKCCLLFALMIGESIGYECDYEATICQTSLDIEHRLTMMHPTEKAVYPKDGKLFRYDVIDTDSANAIPTEDVVTADGWETSRLVVVANGTMPGPPIIMYEGQTIVIHVTNNLKSEDVTIHWHGLHQKGTPYMDGVPYLTQCPIAFGQSFLYKFTANQKGTYWYHSHVGNQRSKGLFGAFIIRERKQPVEIEEHILTIQEWNHDWDSDMEDAKMNFGAYENRTKFQNSKSIDGQSFSILKAHSGLINGRGRFYDLNSGTQNAAPLQKYNVKSRQMYRFRVIAAGALYPWTISIDNHNLTIVASDGYDIEPQVADSFIINAGERFDFIITADQPIGNYWIRAKTLESNRNTTVEAILHYEGADDSDPTSTPGQCTEDNKCLVVNCFFLHYPHDQFTECLKLDQIQQLHSDNDPSPSVTPGKFKEYFLNFAFPGHTFTPGSVNGRRFASPKELVLADPDDADFPCETANCGEQKICTCSYSLNLKHGDTVQINFLNMGSGQGWAHPIHMHGHTFYVLKMGYPVYDNNTGKIAAGNQDIDCRGGKPMNESFCNDATWSNPAWLNGNIPGLELEKPIRKDTIIVPSGGYVVTRIVADNPGVWFMHCHIELHANDGMAIYLNESFDKHPNPPLGFPNCHSYPDNEPSLGADAAVYAESKQEFYTAQNFWIVVGVLCGIVFLQFIILLCCCFRQKKPENEKSYNFNTGKLNMGFS